MISVTFIFNSLGYPSSPFVLRPFTEPEVQRTNGAEKARLRAFNRNLSNKRIYVEHAFGMLKGRFPALKAFPTPDDAQNIYRVIEALMVLHNICIDLHDEPGQIDGYDAGDIGEGMWEEVDEELEADVPDGETNAILREAGLMFRQDMLNRLYPL